MRTGVGASILQMHGREEILLPDTHAHLDAGEFSADFDEMLSRARQAGVDRILAVGEDLSSSRRAVELASRYECVFAAVGVHPRLAQQFRSEQRDLERLLTEDKVVAVGEIGLDAVRDTVPLAVQNEAFLAQLRWAEERSLPVSVHNRGADEAILDALTGSAVTVVLHCFSSTWDFAGAALARACFLSFAGNVTFKSAHELREVARRVPAERLMVETDSPSLAPQSKRGRRNEPANVVETASLLASLRGESLQEMGKQISLNADAVFSWSTL